MKFEFETSEKWQAIYKVNGEMLVAESETELVRLMRKNYYDKPSTNKEHRDRTKNMFYNWDKTQIDATSDESFVRSLIMCGWIKVLSCNRKPLKSQENGSERDISGTICNGILALCGLYISTRFIVGVTLGI